MRGLRKMIVAGALLASGVDLAAQAAPFTSTVGIATPSWAAALERIERPAAPVMGLAVALPVGSGADPADATGASRIAADAVVTEIETRLGLGDVEGRATVEPDRTILVFLVRPDRTPALLEALDEAGFGAGPGSASVATARRRRAEVLRFELDSPLTEVGIERRALLYGTGDPRTRPPGGTLASVEALSDAAVDDARRTLFRRGEARVVVVGPVAPDSDGPLTMSGRTVAVPDPADSTVVSPAAGVPARGVQPSSVPGTTSSGPAWVTGERRFVDREVTNTWISVAFPVPANLPRVAVLYVMDRMDQELNASPPDPGLFNATVELVEMPEGEVLVVDAAVLPETADGFERSILELPARLAAARDAAFFRFHRGRFRATRLVQRAAPEEAARRMAAELLTRGSILSFDDAVWTLDADMAADAAAALGPPRILVFGPDLTGGDDPAPPPRDPAREANAPSEARR